jgi:hypothetical protein
MTRELSALFARDLARLRREIAQFPDDATLWEKVPGVNNPAGNLILHLEGNLREYVGHQMGGVAYQRDRPFEFSGTGLTRADLTDRVAPLQSRVPDLIASFSSVLLDTESGHPEHGSNRSFLLHLYGHFSYHLGQINYIRRIVSARP